MALKSNFEDSNVISSPFVDEVANPGQGGVLGQIGRNVDKQDALLGNTPRRDGAKLSKSDRESRMTDAQKIAQARVDLADKKHGDPKNKNSKAANRAEGR